MMDTLNNRRDGGALPDLLAHLRRKIEVFEDERLSWLSRLETVALSLPQRNKTDRDIRQLERERTELSRAVSDARVSLLQEMGIAFHIQRENLQLERREFDQRQDRLKQLASGGVVEVQQAVTLTQGKRPEAVTKFPNSGVSNDLSLKTHAGVAKQQASTKLTKQRPKTKVLHRVVTINGVGSARGTAHEKGFGYAGQSGQKNGELDESLEGHLQVGSLDHRLRRAKLL